MRIDPVRGFTLLEVMIALTIFAAIAMVVSGTTSQATDTLLQLENKTIASWVAENRLAALRTVTPAPETGDSDDEVEMANRTWRVHTRVEKTQFAGVVRVTVSVAEESQPDYAVVSLATILGNY